MKRKFILCAISFFLSVSLISSSSFAEDFYVSGMSSTPNGESYNSVWESLSVSLYGPDAFWSRFHTPTGSSYLESTTIDGKTEDYYLLNIDVHSSWQHGDRYTIYTTSESGYKAVPYYHNGYYNTWFPSNKFNFQHGVFYAPKLDWKKYSWSKGYYKFHLYDLFYDKNYSLDYFDYYGNKPYFYSEKISNENIIFYGNASVYRDGSGSNILVSIDRKTGYKRTSGSIYFKDNSEFTRGVLMNSNTYAFISSVDKSTGKYKTSYTLYIIDPVTLSIKNKIKIDKNYLLDLDENGNLLLKNGDDDIIIDGDSLTVVEDDPLQDAEDAISELEVLLDDLTTKDKINNAQDVLDEILDSINDLPNSSEKDELLDRLAEAQEAIDLASAELAIANLENLLSDLSTWKLIENAENVYSDVLDLIMDLPDSEEKNALLDRIQSVNDKIIEAKAEISVKDAQEFITQKSVDKAQQYIDQLPDGIKKDELQSKLDFVQEVIDVTETVNATENLLNSIEDSFINGDLSSKDYIYRLEHLLSEFNNSLENAQNELSMLPPTDITTLMDRINKLQQTIYSMIGLTSTLTEIVDEAPTPLQGNGIDRNENSTEITINKNSTVSIPEMFNDILMEQLGTVTELRYLTFDIEDITVTQDGNVTSISNGLSRVTVYNENGKVDFFIISKGNSK